MSPWWPAVPLPRRPLLTVPRHRQQADRDERRREAVEAAEEAVSARVVVGLAVEVIDGAPDERDCAERARRDAGAAARHAREAPLLDEVALHRHGAGADEALPRGEQLPRRDDLRRDLEVVAHLRGSS